MKDKHTNALNKVANLTIAFWAIKVASTTAGEASADFLRSFFGNASVAVMGIALLVTLFIQLSFKRYVPWMYWSVILLVAILALCFLMLFIT